MPCYSIYTWLLYLIWLVICILDYNEPYREHVITSKIDFYHFVKCVHLKLEIDISFLLRKLSVPILALWLIKCILNNKKYLRRPRICRIVKIFIVILKILFLLISAYDILNFVLL